MNRRSGSLPHAPQSITSCRLGEHHHHVSKNVFSYPDQVGTAGTLLVLKGRRNSQPNKIPKEILCTDNVTRKKSVKFQKCASVLTIESKTSEDIRRTWYVGEEERELLQQTKDEIKYLQQVAKNSSQQLNHSTAPPTRGIEQLLDKKHFNQLSAEQDAVIRGVIDTQDYHRAAASHGCVIDAARELAVVSSTFSRNAVQRAYQKAQQDAEDIF